MRHIALALLLIVFGTANLRVQAQPAEPAPLGHTVASDTAAVPYRMLVRSNLVYDAALVPNIGVELPVYRGLTFSGDWNYAWWFSFPKNVFYQTYGGYAGLRYHFGREAAHNPLLGHFAGLSAIALTYDFELRERGYQHDNWNFGVQAEYGYTLPLKNGKWAFTFSLGVGYVRLKYKEYLPMDTHYVYQRSVERDWFGPTRLEVSICRTIEFKSARSRKGDGER
ncbi:MAG: DUF3575 domain-containing protein [Bacteroidales bacterium]|nr:DUF3575 domain-containing protein [Bacteroidales bacterium]